MNEDKCPVCGNKEGFLISAHGPDWTSLHSHSIGSLYLRSCAECGCVYTGKWDRDAYKEYEEKHKQWKVQ